MPPPKITILGGGISGLVTAYQVLERSRERGCPVEITLLEAGPRLGGTIQTEKRDGFTVEKGPDAFLSEKPWALDLCKRLGIESDILGTQNENRKSFVLRKGKLIPIPEGFYLIAPTAIGPFFRTPLFSLAGKIRAMLEPLIPARRGDSDESVGSFIRRRFGKEVLDRVGQAMIAGIYTGDPDRLSICATMPRFQELEKKHGSIIRGLLSKGKIKTKGLENVSGPRYSLFLSFRNGMETLIRKISEKLPAGLVRLNTVVKEITPGASGRQWRLVDQNGQIRMADFVCSTLPAHAMSSILKNACPDLSAKLSRISYESVATINLAYQRETIGHPMDGFGFVVPRVENSPLVACSFSSQKFQHRAPEGFSLIRAFVGGAFGKSWFEKDDRELTQIVEGELRRILSISAPPLFSVLQRYPSSMVQYNVGHFNLLNDIETELKKWGGLTLTGSAYRGVGIPDCIRDAETQAEKLFRRV